MGCDIHDWAEIRRGGRWEIVGDAFANPYYEENEPASNWNRPMVPHPFHQRSYRAFSVLAGVRDRAGIAPVVPPRGVPDDASAEYRREVKQWDRDGHSHSWVTLRELLLYDRHAETEDVTGVVNREGYARWKKTQSRPIAYCESVFGGSVRNVSNEVMERAIAEDDRQYDYRTEVTWRERVSDTTGELWGRTVPALFCLITAEPQALSLFDQANTGNDPDSVYVLDDWLEEHGMPKLDDVRMVFFFDN